jgi:hypothetical protein
MVRWVAAVKLNPHNFRVKAVNGFTADRKQIRPEKGKTSFNPLKTKRRLLYLKTQSVPRCKHFSSQLIKTNQFMM